MTMVFHFVYEEMQLLLVWKIRGVYLNEGISKQVHILV